jgi:hypothetical protein
LCSQVDRRSAPDNHHLSAAALLACITRCASRNGVESEHCGLFAVLGHDGDNDAPQSQFWDSTSDPRAGIGAASALFSVSDGENDTITEYQFWDLTSDPASGHWVVNGFAQGANQAIDVTAAQLAQLLVRSSWPMASRPWGRW